MIRKGMPKTPLWTTEELEILRQHYPTMETCDVAKIIGRTTDTVGRKASLIGLRKDPEWHRDSRRRKALASPNCFRPNEKKIKITIKTKNGGMNIREVPGGRIITHVMRG